MKDKIKFKKLDNFNIVIKTYITLEEEANICDLIMQADNYFERKLKLVTGVFCTVVDDIKDKSDWTYDDIVSSGMWDAIYNELYVYIDEILQAVNYYTSLDYSFTRTLDLVADELNNLTKNLPSLDKVIEVLQNDGNNKILNRKKEKDD